MSEIEKNQEFKCSDVIVEIYNDIDSLRKKIKSISNLDEATKKETESSLIQTKVSLFNFLVRVENLDLHLLLELNKQKEFDKLRIHG